MNHIRPSTEPGRILAIDVFGSGFAYCILDPQGFRIETGLRRPKSTHPSRIITFVRDLLGRYQPTTCVVEDLSVNKARRSSRAYQVLSNISNYVKEQGLQLVHISKTQVRETLQAKTKQAIATQLVESYYPEMEYKLPQKRNIWDSEHPNMNLFDALALGYTYVQNRTKR